MRAVNGERVLGGFCGRSALRAPVEANNGCASVRVDLSPAPNLSAVMLSLRPLLVFCLLSTPALASAPPPDSAAHLFGDIPFRSCALSTRGVASPIEGFCAEVEVPVDASKPAGPKLTISLAWLKPLEKANAAADPVVILAGGPGQSARSLAAYVGRVLHDVRRLHHLLFIDQRGTGASTPFECPEVQEASPQEIPALVRSCRSRFSFDSRFFTTREAVADLEHLRLKLKAARLNMVGVSYGTRVAQEYARAYPAGVRTMVLDGVVPPALALGRGFGRSLDLALQKSMTTCMPTDAGCESPLALLDEALAALRTPKIVHYNDPYTGDQQSAEFGAQELMRLIHSSSYQPLFISTFPQIFRDARDGRWGPLLAQLKISEAAAGISTGMHYAVACAEDVPRLNDADAEAEAKTRLGRLMIDTYRDVCRDWPKPEAPALAPEPLASPVPTLLLSGEWDPVTPPSGAADVAASLTHARSLVLRGQGHNVLAVGCVPRLLERFITAGSEENLDASCIERIKPLPPFTSRTGWDP